LVGGRARAVGLVLRPVRRRRAKCGVVAGGRPATRPRSGGLSTGGVPHYVGSAAGGWRPGGGRRPASLFLDGDIRWRCWLPPASGESTPWVVMEVVELLRSAGGGGGSLLCVGMVFIARGRARCEFGGCLWRFATSVGLALKFGGPISWPKCSGGPRGAGRCRWGLAAAVDDFRPSAPFGVDLGSSSRRRCSVVLGKVSPLLCRWSLVG
jgi:hypothetical protein